MEMYYPPFKSAIDAGAGAVMCSYNKINNIYSCENNQTLNYHLREIMGFDGFVMSDWGAVYSGPKTYISSGMDQEQGSLLRWFTKKALKSEVS